MSAADRQDPPGIGSWIVWDRSGEKAPTAWGTYEEAVAFLTDPDHPERALLSISPVYDDRRQEPGRDRRQAPRRAEERGLHYAREALLACALQMAERPPEQILADRSALQDRVAAYRLAEAHYLAVSAARQGVER